MNINIICIGKLKEKYWQAAVAEYTKRIGGVCPDSDCGAEGIEAPEERIAGG